MLTFSVDSVMDEMRRLINKYPEGYEGWAREKGLA